MPRFQLDASGASHQWTPKTAGELFLVAGDTVQLVVSASSDGQKVDAMVFLTGPDAFRLFPLAESGTKGCGVVLPTNGMSIFVGSEAVDGLNWKEGLLVFAYGEASPCLVVHSPHVSLSSFQWLRISDWTLHIPGDAYFRTDRWELRANGDGDMVLASGFEAASL